MYGSDRDTSRVYANHMSTNKNSKFFRFAAITVGINLYSFFMFIWFASDIYRKMRWTKRKKNVSLEMASREWIAFLHHFFFPFSFCDWSNIITHKTIHCMPTWANRYILLHRWTIYCNSLLILLLLFFFTALPCIKCILNFSLRDAL